MDEPDELPEELRHFKQLFDAAVAAIRRKDDESSISLLEQLIQLFESKGTRFHWAFEALAKVMRRRKDFKSEISVLERYFALDAGSQSERQNLNLADRLEDARDELRSYVADRGTCDLCGGKKRVLKRSDSGQLTCVTCRSASGAKRKEDRVSSNEKRLIREAGLEVPSAITKEQATHLKELALRRRLGLNDDASDYEVSATIRRKQFCTKVVGVTFSNPDGVSRQSIISKCEVGEGIRLVREPDNPLDPSAVRVCRLNGETIGYLGRHIATTDMGMTGVASRLDDGMVADVAIMKITPVGDREDNILGVVIEIILTLPIPTMPSTDLQNESQTQT